jgi:hypothetical protein
MKTLITSLCAVLLFANVLAGNDSGKNNNTGMNTKQAIVFAITKDDVLKNVSNTKSADLEMKDFSNFTFNCNIDQVNENASRVDVGELNDPSKILFRITTKEVFDNLNLEKSVKELTASEIGFTINISKAADNALKTAYSGLDAATQPTYAFSLNIDQVNQTIKNINDSELSVGEPMLANIDK